VAATDETSPVAGRQQCIGGKDWSEDQYIYIYGTPYRTTDGVELDAEVLWAVPRPFLLSYVEKRGIKAKFLWISSETCGTGRQTRRYYLRIV